MARVALIALIILLIVPAVTFGSTKFPNWGSPLLSCVGGKTFGEKGGLPVCTSLCDVLDTTQNFVYFGMTLVLFIIVPGMVLVGGFMVMAAGAKPDLMSKGKDAILNAVLGLAIVLGAFVIINTFLWLVGVRTTTQGASQGSAISWPNLHCEPGSLPGTIPASVGTSPSQ